MTEQIPDRAPLADEPGSHTSRRTVLAAGAVAVAGALAGCQVYGRPDPAPPPPPEPEPTDEVDDEAEEGEEEPDPPPGDEEPDDDEPGVTVAELTEADGKDGRRCLVAVDGVVYEIEGFGLWENGEHPPSGGRAFCGADMSDVIRQAPHGVERVQALTEIGPLIT